MKLQTSLRSSSADPFLRTGLPANGPIRRPITLCSYRAYDADQSQNGYK